MKLIDRYINCFINNTFEVNIFLSIFARVMSWLVFFSKFIKLSSLLYFSNIGVWLKFLLNFFMFRESIQLYIVHKESNRHHRRTIIAWHPVLRSRKAGFFKYLLLLNYCHYCCLLLLRWKQHVLYVSCDFDSMRFSSVHSCILIIKKCGFFHLYKKGKNCEKWCPKKCKFFAWTSWRAAKKGTWEGGWMASVAKKETNNFEFCVVFLPSLILLRLQYKIEKKNVRLSSIK